MRSSSVAFYFGTGAVMTVIALIASGAACSSSYAEATPAPASEAGTEASASDAQGAADALGSLDGASDVAVAPTLFVLASGFGALSGIAATETTVYFVDRAKGIYSVPIAGGAPSQIFVQAGTSPSGIVLGGADLFWTDAANLTLDRVTTAGNNVVLALGGKTPLAIAAGADRVVVVLVAASSGNGDVQQFDFIPTAGSAVMELANPFDVAVRGTEIFWTDAAAGIVRTTQFGSNLPGFFVNGESGCQSIAVDDLGVYWARPSAGVVRYQAPASAAPISLATSEQSPFSLAADDSGVYWMTADGKLRRSTRSELPLATLAQGFAGAFSDRHVQAVALTSKYVVWVTTDGKVLRLEK